MNSIHENRNSLESYSQIRERLADSVNSARGVGMENVKVTRPKPGSKWDGGDY